MEVTESKKKSPMFEKKYPKGLGHIGENKKCLFQFSGGVPFAEGWPRRCWLCRREGERQGGKISDMESRCRRFEGGYHPREVAQGQGGLSGPMSQLRGAKITSSGHVTIWGGGVMICLDGKKKMPLGVVAGSRKLATRLDTIKP